jgi:hypothetical protein
MDDLQLVRHELGKLRLSELDSVANGSGVPVDTIIKLKYGTTKNPRYETVKPVADFLRSQGKDPDEPPGKPNAVGDIGHGDSEKNKATA